MSTTKESAEIWVFGDICSYEWAESDVSSYSVATAISALDVPEINVYINSYGGEVAEGLAIYNALTQHPAKVNTYCYGFACSAASVVFMAGDNRHMMDSSLLMIHNAWQHAAGNASELRKAADDLEKISGVSANTYKHGLNITDDELSDLLASETWISPEEALEMGFATAIIATPQSMKASQHVRQKIIGLVRQIQEPAAASADPADPTEPQQPEPPVKEDLNQKTFFNFKEKE